jgi:hypothetical protein
MYQATPLTLIVKQIDTVPKNLPPSEKVIFFNRRDRKTLDKKPLIGGSHIEYYHVSTTEIETYKDLPITVEDYTTDRKLGLLVNYQASCELGNERQLIEGLCSDNLPSLNLNKRIERWIRDLTRDRATDFIDHFVTRLRWLEQELRQQAETIGLRLDVQVTPDKEGYMYYLISTARATQPLAVRENLTIPFHDVTNDRNMGVSIAYTARLRDAKNRDQAIKELSEHSSVEDALDEKIKEWSYEFVGDQTAKFIDNYDGQFVGLKSRLENNAKTYLNLLLDTRIEAEGNPVEEIIFKTKDPSNIAQGTHTIPIRGIATGRDISIVVTYQAGFFLGDRQRVLQAFSSSKSLPSEINRRLETWVARFIDQKTADEFITHYTDVVQDLKEFIQQKASTETGLHLELRLVLDKQDKLISFEIGSSQRHADLAVHVKDYDSELKLKFHTILIADEDNIINAVLRSQPRDEVHIAGFIKKKINEFLLAEVTLDKFCYELKTNVRDGLLKYLNLSLKEYGRKVGFLSLDSDDVSSVVPRKIIEIDYSVICTVQGYSKPISVRNIVQMLPDRSNLAMFRKMVPENLADGLGKTPLRVWVESELEKIVKPELLQKRYIDVLTKFDTVSDVIKKGMQESASKIGFSVEQIVSVPNLKHDELKRDFLIEIEEERYRTSDANVEVKLNTAVTARIENFGKIEAYLDPDTNVQDLMKTAIHNTIRDHLDNVDPERYYMRFYHHRVNEKGQPIVDQLTGNSETRSVKQELVEKITKLLEETFGAKVINVVPRQRNTDIIERFNELQGKIGRFEFEIRPSGGEAVKFFAEFQVLGVESNSWYLFQARIEDLQRLLQPLRQERDRLQAVYSRQMERSFIDDEAELEKTRDRILDIERELSGIDVIRQAIESGVRDQLTQLGNHLSANLAPQQLDALKIKINEWARASVKRQYGLEVSVENLHRLSTPEEDRQAALQSKSQEARYTLKENEVDKVLALAEADKDQHETYIRMLKSDRQAKFNELKLLHEKRARLITKLDPESYEDELKHLDQQIEALVKEVSVPSLESAAGQLQAIAAQPTSEPDNFFNLLEQLGASPKLGSSQNPSQIESQSTDEPVIEAEVIDNKNLPDARETPEE